MAIFRILGDRLRDREWRRNKTKKTGNFWLDVSLITQKPLDLRSGNLDTMWLFVNASYKPSLGATGHMTKILRAENGQKVDKFEPTYLGNYRY